MEYLTLNFPSLLYSKEKGYYLAFFNFLHKKTLEVRLKPIEAEEFRLTTRLIEMNRHFGTSFQEYLIKKGDIPNSCFIIYDNQEYSTDLHLENYEDGNVTLEPNFISGICTALMVECEICMDTRNFKEQAKDTPSYNYNEDLILPKNYSTYPVPQLKVIMAEMVKISNFEEAQRIKEEIDSRDEAN